MEETNALPREIRSELAALREDTKAQTKALMWNASIAAAVVCAFIA